MSDFSLWALFATAFLSSTLLPGGSEVGLVLLNQDPAYSGAILIGVATLGNTLGGMTTWLMGYWLAERFPARALGPQYQPALRHLGRWGSPALLLSWLPVLGDPLCLAAGWLRVSPLSAILFMAMGKGLRYGTILWLTN